MMKAQELAEAILNSEIYQKMKQQEAATRRDPEAARVLADMIEKRNKVESVLSDAYTSESCAARTETRRHLRQKSVRRWNMTITSTQ